jgi:hypothetical protein
MYMPSRDEWRKKCGTKHNSAIKKNELMSFAGK